MSVESILSKKGADVATIAPDASVKRAADWLLAKNIGVSRRDEWQRNCWPEFPSVKSFTHFLAMARMPRRCL